VVNDNPKGPVEDNSLLEVCLFPLHQTFLFPYTTITLNIFEHRYLEMVEYSVAKKVPIGLICNQKVPQTGSIRDLDYKSLVGEALNRAQIFGLGHPVILGEVDQQTKLVAITGHATGIPKFLHHEENFTSVWTEVHYPGPKLDPKYLFRINRLKKDLFKCIREKIDNPNIIEQFEQSCQGPEQVIGHASLFLMNGNHQKWHLLGLEGQEAKLDYIYQELYPTH